MYIAILGRQAALGIAELEARYKAPNVRWFSDQSALIESSALALDQLGGTQKAGIVRQQLKQANWRTVSTKIIQMYSKELSSFTGKLTLGISAYGFTVSERDVQKTGIILKQKLKQAKVSLRLIPNTTPALSSATSHHNKLGLSENKKELLVVRAANGDVIIAESSGAQNITAYTRRDQERPKRDAFVGMLPPKLAQIIVNLSGAERFDTLWDPFCGTGVLLQEALLMEIDVYGSDISEKMIDYSQANLEWLAARFTTAYGKPLATRYTLTAGDATKITFKNKHTSPLKAVACETYLGQPFSAPPSPQKLEQVRGNCDAIISDFLKNIAPQLASGTRLCVAVPAWHGTDGTFTHLRLIQQLAQLGYTRHTFKNVKNEDLLYFREDQVVARELLVLVKS